MLTKYDLDKIKFASDSNSFAKAVSLYENKKVIQFKEELNGFFAHVIGSELYRVYVSRNHFDRGACSCYLGERDILCKHMLAVAIYAVKEGKALVPEDKEIIEGAMCSGQLGELSAEELSTLKKEVSLAIRYIKAYAGPSRTWFAYQGSLDEGCARLAKIVSKLPVSQQTAKLLIDILLKLDKRLCSGGVDDSNGTVGGFIEETVNALKEYAQLDPSCIKSFNKLTGLSTCFDWEEPLLNILDE